MMLAHAWLRAAARCASSSSAGAATAAAGTAVATAAAAASAAPCASAAAPCASAAAATAATSNTTSGASPSGALAPSRQQSSACGGETAGASGFPDSALHFLSSARPLVVGRFARARAALDYSWHPRYNAERQLLQDEIVQHFLDVGCMCRSPWLVFTAGAMGAGKSWTMRHFQAVGAFPLRHFVVVDADKIRRCLPEMPHYLQHHRAHAGSLTHRESGYLAEVITREAMTRSKNVLIDGSLRDADWYARVFRRVRADFGEYRIAILLVTAPRDVVVARATRRGAVTGREIPPDILDDALHNVPRSYERLAPLADYTAVINNADDGSPPTFSPPATTDAFRRMWTHLCDDVRHAHGAAPAAPATAPTRVSRGSGSADGDGVPPTDGGDAERFAADVPAVRARLAHRARARLVDGGGLHAMFGRPAGTHHSHAYHAPLHGDGAGGSGDAGGDAADEEDAE